MKFGKVLLHLLCLLKSSVLTRMQMLLVANCCHLLSQGMLHIFAYISWTCKSWNGSRSRSFSADCTQKCCARFLDACQVPGECACVCVWVSVWAKWQRRLLTMATHTLIHTQRQTRRRSWLPFVRAEVAAILHWSSCAHSPQHQGRNYGSICHKSCV